jgi:hypothetical protein
MFNLHDEVKKNKISSCETKKDEKNQNPIMLTSHFVVLEEEEDMKIK